MKIFVRVKLHAKHAAVTRIDDTHFEISVHERPVDGKANQAIIRAVADYFHIAQSRIHIIRGERSSQKTISILD